MSCLTAPPLVSVLSLSRVQSQINRRLFLTLTYPSTRLHLQLAPLLSHHPPSPQPVAAAPREGPGSPGAAWAAAFDIAPLCPGFAAVLSVSSRERPPVPPSPGPTSAVPGAAASRLRPANLGLLHLVTTITTKSNQGKKKHQENPRRKKETIRQNRSSTLTKTTSFLLALKVL